MQYRTVWLYHIPTPKDLPHDAARRGLGSGMFTALMLSLPVSMGIWYAILLGIIRLTH